jgi:hypothetical protein
MADAFRISLKKIFNPFLAFIFPFVIYWAILNLSPLSRVGLVMRYGFTIALIPFGLLLYLAFKKSGYSGIFLGLTVVLIGFGLPLVGLWGSGESESHLLAGLIPMKDAAFYYVDAKRLLAGFPSTDFSSRRPLFTVILALILGLTGQNLQVSLAVLVVITALACYLAAREIQATHGTLAAIFFICINFMFYRLEIGKTQTEALGFPLGVLGFLFIWRAVRNKQLSLSLLGLFLLSLALNARAGAFFILPALVLWITMTAKKKQQFFFFVLSSLAVILGFALNYLIFRAITTPGEGALFSNFSHTLYGLVTGGRGWAAIFDDHPEIWLLHEPVLSQTIYHYAFEAFLSNPFNTIIGAVRNWATFFSLNVYSSFCFFGGYNQAGLTDIAGKLGLYGLGLFGIGYWIKNRKDSFYPAALFALAGILLSVPFAPPTDASNMRAYAATIPFYSIIPVLGMAALFAWIKSTQIWKRMVSFSFMDRRLIKWFKNNVLLFSPGQVNFPIISLAFTFVLILALGLSPWLIRPLVQSYSLPALSCEEGTTPLYIRVDRGSFVHVSTNETQIPTWLPNLKQVYFQRRAHDLPNGEYFSEFDAVSPDSVILYDVDLLSGTGVLLIDPVDMLTQSSQVFGVCGINTVYEVYHVESAIPIDFAGSGLR